SILSSSRWLLRATPLPYSTLFRSVLSNQVLFILVHRQPLNGMLDWAARSGHAVIAYSPLAQGFLSGRYDAYSRPTIGVRAMNPLDRKSTRLNSSHVKIWYAFFCLK